LAAKASITILVTITMEFALQKKEIQVRELNNHKPNVILIFIHLQLC